MDLLKLEQQRESLEENLQQLRQSLRHWQTWEAEYEALKEEVSQLQRNTISAEEAVQIAETCGGDLVNQNEVLSIAGLSTGSPRSPEQMIGIIQRRQEYVHKNIETVQSRFFEAEAKQEELAFAAASHGFQDEGSGSLPLTEIVEELDDDDNVIASHLSRPEEETAGMVDSLRKAGFSEEELNIVSKPGPSPEALKPALVNATPPLTPLFDKKPHSDSYIHTTTAHGSKDDHERPSVRKKSVSFTADTKAPPEKPRPQSVEGRKSVSFADKVAVMPAAPPPDTRSVSFSSKVEEIPAKAVDVDSKVVGSVAPSSIVVQADPEKQKELREAFKPGDKVVQLNDDDEIESVQVVLPEDESPDDAATRREMLEYHLNEVGNIVAQIDMEESQATDGEDDDDDVSSFYTTSEHWDDEDTPYTTGHSDSEDEEDEHGRSTRHMISPTYRKQMLELEKRLIGNLGPQPTDEDVKDADTELDPADVRRLVIRDKRNSTSSASSDGSDKKSSSKKRVSFASSVQTASPMKAQKLDNDENKIPTSAIIPERAVIDGTAGTETISNSDAAAFHDTPLESDHEEAFIERPPPTGPKGRTLADTLTERIPTHQSAVAPSMADAEAIADRRQLANEYYKRRNDIIREQGGFEPTPDMDDMYGELMEERDGRLKKVSRFKAARIKPQ